MADSGRLSEAVKVCDWLLGYPAVAGALETRRDAILGLTPSFEPSGDKRRSTRAVKALEAGSDYWASYPESELGQMIMWRTLLGVAPARQPWTQPLDDHDGRILPNLEFWHPAGLRYDFSLATWFGKDENETEFEIVPGDGTHVLHALAKFHPWMLGAWRRVSRFVLLAYLATQDWSRHSEKTSMLVATSNQASTAEQRKQLARDLANSGDDLIVVLQAGFDLKLVELTADTEKIYKAQIDLADKVIATLILGGNLSTNVGENGARAAVEAQVKAGQLPRLRADAEALSTTLHDQSLTWWAEFNFGDAKLAPWPVYPTEPEEDKKAKAETIKTLSDSLSALDKLGFEFDVTAVKEEFGIDWISGRTKPKEPPVVQPKPGSGSPEGGQVPRATSASRLFALASGADPVENRGFIEGQLYTDDVAESATDAALEILQLDQERIMDALNSATSFDDLKSRLRELYRGMDPDALRSVVSRAMRMAYLGGQHAVNEDS